MAIKIKDSNGNVIVSRNLQEQVAKNQRDIIDLANQTDTEVEALKGRVTTTEEDIAAIKDGTNIDSFKKVEDALDLKADKSTTYTKTEVEQALNSKINIATISLTGTSGTLTLEQLEEIVDNKNIFILLQDGEYENLFYKGYHFENEYFNQMFFFKLTRTSINTTANDTFTIANSQILIDLSNGNWAYSAGTNYTTYNKNKIDELIAGAGGTKYLHHINVIGRANYFSFDLYFVLDNNTPIQLMSGLFNLVNDGQKVALTGSFLNTLDNQERICLYGYFDKSTTTNKFRYYTRNVSTNTVGFASHEGSDFNTYTVQDTITEF